MMNGRERILWKLLGRRLKSSGGNAYLEFTVIVPFVLFLVFFAVDFMRILYCEQQIEIASRLLADCESHMIPQNVEKQNYPDLPNYYSPHSYGKMAVRQYLYDVLHKEGLEKMGKVYCRGWIYAQKGLAQGIFNPILDFLNGQSKDIGPVVKIIGKIFKTVLDIVTMGTDRYFTDILPTDRCAMTSVSVIVKPLVPFGAYTCFGRHTNTKEMLIVQAAPTLSGGAADFNRDLLDDKRERYYCHMPVMDTHPLAVVTYIRKIKQVLGRFL